MLLLPHSLDRVSCYIGSFNGRAHRTHFSMEDYQCYIVSKACGLGYICNYGATILENEICHIMFIDHYKKLKSTIFICVHLLGRAYNKYRSTKASIGQKRSNEVLTTLNQTFGAANKILPASLFEYCTPHLYPTLLTFHHHLKFLIKRTSIQ